MKKLKYFLIFMVIFTVFACGDDTKENECNTKCKSWESCVNGKCEITEKGYCTTKDDCINEEDICLENKCVPLAKCMEWETYVEATNTCIMTPGRCLTEENCNAREYCSEDKYCKRYPNINWTDNCPPYVSTNAECAKVNLPLDYNKNDNKTVEIFVIRHKALSGNAKAQVWFLQGGPGGSGATFSKYYFDQYTQKYPDYDFYTLDHRGVGNSTRISCSQENDLSNLHSLRECTRELETSLGDDLNAFSTTNAAKDVAFLMDMLKENGKKRFVYGVSYGTYWAERYLTIFPNQADGVILDSICTLQHCYFDDYSKWTDVVGHQFMDVCKDDTTCNQKMNEINTAEEQTPQEAMKYVLDNIESHPCNFGYGAFSKADTQVFLTTMLMNFYARLLIPPVLVRLNRCNDDDKQALKKLLDNLYGGMHGKSLNGFYVDEDKVDSNPVLYYNIVFSELWYGRTEEEITEVYNNSLFNTGNGLDMYRMKNSGYWNEYNDEFIKKLPQSNIPVLMLNGTLDPQTALEIALPTKEFLNKEHQYFLTFPQTPHGVVASSYTNQMISNYGQGTSCGEKIMFEFLDNPEHRPDTSCYNDMYKISWNDRLIRGMGYMYMGTSNVWGGNSKSYYKVSPEFKKAVKDSMERTYLEYQNYSQIMDFINRIKK